MEANGIREAQAEAAFWGPDPAMRPYGLDPGRGPAKGSVPVSVAIITKDEEARLPACLASLAFAAEVVVVDAQSSDRTAEIAAAAGAKVHVRPWPGYTAQRNFSLTQCAHDWVLCVDADVRVSLALATEIGELLQAGPDRSAYRLAEVNRYFGRWLMHGGIYPGHHIRLFNRHKHAFETGPSDVHEDIRCADSGALKGHLLHLAYPSFRLALGKLNHYTDLEARGRAKKRRGPRLVELMRRPLSRFLSNYFLKGGFRDGFQGFLYCCLTALYAFTTTVKVWEIERDL
jgi:glycosyltransferase involved in cell wall biosynthesis